MDGYSALGGGGPLPNTKVHIMVRTTNLPTQSKCVVRDCSPVPPTYLVYYIFLSLTRKKMIFNMRYSLSPTPVVISHRPNPVRDEPSVSWPNLCCPCVIISHRPNPVRDEPSVSWPHLWRRQQ